MPMPRAAVLYGLSYLPTDRPVVKLLAILPSTLPDTYRVVRLLQLEYAIHWRKVTNRISPHLVFPRI